MIISLSERVTERDFITEGEEEHSTETIFDTDFSEQGIEKWKPK